MRNVEFKAELRDVELARSVCRALGAVYVETVGQLDTYFRVPDGRLKKREVAGQETEYIFYERDDVSGYKISRFTIYPEQRAVERFGVRPMPVWVVVRKRRELYLFDGVLIHLDEVDGLGRFLELEALVTSARNEKSCRDAVQRLRDKLGPALGEPIAGSYSDLAAQEAAPE